MTYYRLIFKNGTYSAWTRNYELIVEHAKFFDARIDSRVFRN